jgi:RNA polymerase sigma factor (TIGR02999 family)
LKQIFAAFSAIERNHMNDANKISDEHLVTGLLLDWSQGSQAAYEQLVPLVYEELRRIARREMSKERPEHTLQPSALVNEAFLRLIDYHQVTWENRRHFFRLAAKMMRQVLINYAASRKSAKRGGAAQRGTLDEALMRAETRALELDELLALNEALERLEREDERCAKVVELMFFGGLSEKESASELGISDRTVKREWRYARLWLRRELGGSVSAESTSNLNSL